MLLTLRWSWVRLVYRVAVALLGLVLLIAADFIAGRLDAPRPPTAAFRLLGVALMALSVGILGSVAAYYDPGLFESLALGAATGFFAGALDHYLSNSATC